MNVDSRGRLTVVGVTDTSVTLAWDPENPAAGAVTYGVYLRHFIHDPKGSGGTVWYPQIGSGTVTGLKPGSAHLWFVSGMDAFGYASPLGLVYVVVTNPVPAPAQLNGVATTADGGFQLTAAEGGSVLQTVLIQATTNPVDPSSWVQIGSVLPTSNPFTFTDPDAAQYAARFYRIIAP
jgi:hypothetical protein